MDCSLYIIGFRPLLSNVPSLTEYLHFLIFLENGKKNWNLVTFWPHKPLKALNKHYLVTDPVIPQIWLKGYYLFFTVYFALLQNNKVVMIIMERSISFVESQIVYTQ